MYPAVTEVKDDADGCHCRDAVGFLLWGNRQLKIWLRSQGLQRLEAQFLVELEETEQVIGWLGRRWL